MLENPQLLANSSTAGAARPCDWMDDFEQEIEETRANDELIAHLQLRAQQPATVPLQEVKRRLFGSLNPR